MKPIPTPTAESHNRHRQLADFWRRLRTEDHRFLLQEAGPVLAARVLDNDALKIFLDTLKDEDPHTLVEALEDLDWADMGDVEALRDRLIEADPPFSDRERAYVLAALRLALRDYTEEELAAEPLYGRETPLVDYEVEPLIERIEKWTTEKK